MENISSELHLGGNAYRNQILDGIYFHIEDAVIELHGPVASSLPANVKQHYD